VTLDLIRSLVNDGLLELGDLATDEGRFSPWTDKLDVSIERIRHVYVSIFEEENVWPWHMWLKLAETGEKVARETEPQLQRLPNDDRGPR